MKEAEIREKISDGWIRALVTIEVAGKPKEHIEQSLTTYIENIKKDERIAILHDDREPAEEHDDGIFTTFSECEMLVESLETFNWLCVNFSPASIEILEPERLTFEERDLTNWMNDLLAKIHEIGIDYREKKEGNRHLTTAMNALIQNSILLSLKTGGKTIEELSKETGVVPPQLEQFLKHLTEKKRVKQENDTYTL